MKEVHICPVLMRTVIFENGRSIEDCNEEDCPCLEMIRNTDNSYACKC